MIEAKEIKNPFPGLRPFEADEYLLFFGREGQSDALIARLQSSHFLAVVGTSGSGKSSLIRAGLLPALRGGMMTGAGSGWRIAIMRPGSDPIGNLAIALADKAVLLAAGGGLPGAEAEAVIEATLSRGSLGLVDAFRQARLAEHEKLLVIVDQFEELFRFRAARPPSSTADDAAAFVKLLLEASQQSDLSIYVVLTMRSDFLGDCAQFQGLPEAINDGQYLIPRMTRDERRFAITGPVGVTRGKISEPLVNRLMNDVGDNPDQLPILQHALMRTWDYWAGHRNGGDPIGLEHYEAVGTMSDALSRHADEAFDELPNQRGRLVAEILFKALTERGVDNREIRRPTCLKDICRIADASAEEVVAVIDIFRGGGRSFLMPPAEVALLPETVIDISHESLIRNWQRLKTWVNQEAQSARTYRRLAEDAVLHREGTESLLQDPALQIALDWRDKNQPNAAWAQRYHPEFEEALTYLEKSRAARDAALAERERARQEQIERDRRELEQAQTFAEKQRQNAQRMRRFTYALVVISVFAFVGAIGTAYAFWASRSTLARVERAADLDEEGDAFLVGSNYLDTASFKAAEAKYLKALAERKTDREKRISWEKLSDFYRLKKDYATAEKYQNLVVHFYKDESKLRDKYAGALLKLGTLLGEVPNRFDEAVSNYRKALAIYKELPEPRDWRNQEIIFFRLSRLYQKPTHMAERQRALEDRVTILAEFFNQMATSTGPPRSDAVFLLSEYLYAIDSLAVFYTGAKNDGAAEATYQRADAAFTYITGNIQKDQVKLLGRYAVMLKSYQQVLRKLNKQARAESVAAHEAAIRKLLPQTSEPPEIPEPTKEDAPPAATPQ